MNLHVIAITYTPHNDFVLSPIYSIQLRNRAKSSIPSCRFGHGRGVDVNNLFFKKLDLRAGRRKINSTRFRASRRESPYQVLGVSPAATPVEIKRAYRKLALKFHPDVNKEANAQEKFLRIKHAYNTLVNSESRRKYDYGNGASDFSYNTSEGSRSRNTQEEQEFYGFGSFVKDVQITIGDFFKDIQEEYRNWEASAGSQGKPKSLWEELAEIGEEFVGFLEKELNIPDSGDEGPKDYNPSRGSGTEKNGTDVQNKASEQKSSIEDNIDEIEATLAQLKKELGL